MSPVVPLAVATLLSLHGLRSGSLSPSGAATAFLVGFTVFAAPVRAFGVSLIVFYLVGSRATKYGKQRKARLEDGYLAAGYRSGWQVLSNALVVLTASVAWGVTFAPHVVPFSFLHRIYPVSQQSVPYDDANAWCPLSSSISDGLSRTLLFATLGQLACSLGDTLASELGILSSLPPILITTLKPVPPGTNGGVSLGGTLASLSGGLIMGLTMFLTLARENAACRSEWNEILLPLLGWGTLAGGLGSLLDSFLGATVQCTRYSRGRKLIMQDGYAPSSSAELEVISGVDLLTNNQVNLVSSTALALLVAWFA